MRVTFSLDAETSELLTTQAAKMSMSKSDYLCELIRSVTELNYLRAHAAVIIKASEALRTYEAEWEDCFNPPEKPTQLLP